MQRKQTYHDVGHGLGHSHGLLHRGCLLHGRNLGFGDRLCLCFRLGLCLSVTLLLARRTNQVKFPDLAYHRSTYLVW